MRKAMLVLVALTLSLGGCDEKSAAPQPFEMSGVWLRQTVTAADGSLLYSAETDPKFGFQVNAHGKARLFTQATDSSILFHGWHLHVALSADQRSLQLTGAGTENCHYETTVVDNDRVEAVVKSEGTGFPVGARKVFVRTSLQALAEDFALDGI